MKSSELPPYQLALTLAFIVLGVVALIVRARVEWMRGKRGRTTFLVIGACIGPVFGATAYFSHILSPPMKSYMNAHPLLVWGVVGGIIALAVALPLVLWALRSVEGPAARWIVALVVATGAGVGAAFGLRATDLLGGFSKPKLTPGMSLGFDDPAPPEFVPRVDRVVLIVGVTVVAALFVLRLVERALRPFVGHAIVRWAVAIALAAGTAAGAFFAVRDVELMASMAAAYAAVGVIVAMLLEPLLHPVIRLSARSPVARWPFAVVVSAGIGCTALAGAGVPMATKALVKYTDTIASGIALICAGFFSVAVLAALLPWLLDRLEGTTFVTFVATRHVRSQKSGFLTVVSVLSICAVAISSCALSSTVSIMGGFSQDLKRKILGNNAHIVIDTTAQTPWADYDPVLAHVGAVPGVAAATPVVHGEVMVSSASNIAGVIVRGVDPLTIGNVIELPNNIEVPKRHADEDPFDPLKYLKAPEALLHLPPDEVIGLSPSGDEYRRGPDFTIRETGIDDDVKHAVPDPNAPQPRPGLIVGRELAKTLHVYLGDEVTLVSPLGDLGPMGVMPRTKKFRVAAIFFSGMYEYDASHVYTMLDVAQEYFELKGKISAIDVRVEDAENAEQFTAAVTTAVGRADLRVRDWRDINKNLFSALKLERFATFIILSIAIMVASFCIVSTLLLMITEKSKEIAILKAVGARDGSILRTFMFEGIIIGGIGTIFGIATAFVLCTDLSWFGLRLDPDVYYIDRLPINVSGLDFLAVTLAAVIICTLATIFPAYAASQIRPVDGLRYE